MAKKKNKNDLVKVTHEPHKLPFQLGVEEKAEAAEQLATTLQAAESLELERKSVLGEFKSRLNALEERIHKLTLNVKDGVEMRSVECELHLNYTTLTATLIRSDTKDVVEERPMTDEEKQMNLDFEE